MEEILASIRRIISDEVAAEPATARNEASRAGREAPAARAAAPAREPAPRAAAPAPSSPPAAVADAETLSYAPPPFRERVESPVDYAPRGRAPAADPFTSRPVTVAAAALAATPFTPPAVVSRAPAAAVYSGGSAARALDVPAPTPVASENRPPEPRRTEPRLFPDSRPMPDLRPLPEVRPRGEPRLVEPRSVEPRPPAPEPRPAVAPVAAPVRASMGPAPAASLSALPPLRPSYARPAAVKLPAPLDSDLDKPLAAALLDLALVEQAVQAELANVALNEPAAAPERAVAQAARAPEAKPVMPEAPKGGAMRPAYGAASHISPGPVVAPSAAPAPVASSSVAPEGIDRLVAVPATTLPAAGMGAAAESAAEAQPVAEPSEMPTPPRPVVVDSGPVAPVAPSRDAPPPGAAASGPVADAAEMPRTEPRAPETRAHEPRLTETRPSEPRSYEGRSSDARLSEPRVSETGLLDVRRADARSAETRLAESRSGTGSRPAPVAEPTEPARERLVSAPASSAVAAAFDTLQRTMSSLPPRSIDDLVTDALKPMLKQWLDDNLPALVERLVRAEIERVARHGQ